MNAKMDSVRTLMRTRYERQGELSMNAKADSVCPIHRSQYVLSVPPWMPDTEGLSSEI